MNQYSVTADKNAEGWYVKIEDTAPTEYYDKKDKAIEAAKTLAQQNTPSKLTVYEDNNNDVQGQQTYEK